MAVAAPGTEQPGPENIKVFKVLPGQFVKMDQATWHAGPHFEGVEFMDFCNLELADTNIVDHHNHFMNQSQGVRIRIEDCE